MSLRATSVARAAFVIEKPAATIFLDAQERHLRRKIIRLGDGTEILVDLEKTVKLENHDCLVLEDGRLIRIEALPEDLLEVRAKTAAALARLAWHIGNRHLEAQIEKDRILIRPDQVIARMLEAQGAEIRKVSEPFSPEHGAYSHGH